MTGIIIQARKGSTRLPNKMVLPFFKEKGVLELLIEKLTQQFESDKIALATTKNFDDIELINIANKYRINTFTGSETNVLDRFIKTAENFKYSKVIRICADNPFLDLPHITTLIDEIESNNYDYVSYKTQNGLPTIKSHLGLYTEAITLKALKRITLLTSSKLFLEHVTNYVYTHSEHFKLKLLELPAYMNNTESIRLTLDTIDDFNYEKKLYIKSKGLSTKDLIESIRKNENILKLMTNQIEKISK